MQSLDGQKSDRPAIRARQLWHAPENQPLQLTVKNPLHSAGDPRTAAGFGVVLLLAVGVLGAFVVDKTASSRAEADPQPVALPGPKPIVVQTTRVTPPETPAPKLAAQNSGQVYAAASQAAASEGTQEPSDQRLAASGTATSAAHPTTNPLVAKDLPGVDSSVMALGGQAPDDTPVAGVDGDETVVTATIMLPDQPVPVPTAAPRREKIADETAPKTEAADDDTTRGRIKTAVNMRASGTDRAKVIGVVPANAFVKVVGCKSWCEIVYKDQRGWIYKGFLR